MWLGNSIAARVNRVVKERVKAAQQKHNERVKALEEERDNHRKSLDQAHDIAVETSASSLVESIIGKP